MPLSKKNEPLVRQVYKGLRKAILSGAFPAGGRLPSTRDLAEQLGVSRTVVLLARCSQSGRRSSRRRGRRWSRPWRELCRLWRRGGADRSC
jgi:DNA-binding transcriptional MocR family regulator